MPFWFLGQSTRQVRKACKLRFVPLHFGCAACSTVFHIRHTVWKRHAVFDQSARIPHFDLAKHSSSSGRTHFGLKVCPSTEPKLVRRLRSAEHFSWPKSQNANLSYFSTHRLPIWHSLSPLILRIYRERNYVNFTCKTNGRSPRRKRGVPKEFSPKTCRKSSTGSLQPAAKPSITRCPFLLTLSNRRVTGVNSIFLCTFLSRSADLPERKTRMEKRKLSFLKDPILASDSPQPNCGEIGPCEFLKFLLPLRHISSRMNCLLNVM